jgi:hypothetical protein
MLHQPGQPFVVNTSPIIILQPINEVKGHAHQQILTCLKLVSIIFEQFWMACCTFDLNLPTPKRVQIHRDPWCTNHQIFWLQWPSLMSELVLLTIKFGMAPLEVGPEFAANF